MSLCRHRVALISFILSFLVAKAAEEAGPTSRPPVATANQRDFTWNLPLAVIDTSGRAIPQRDRILANLMIIGRAEGNSFGGPIEFRGPVTVAVRGSGTTSFAKKAYRLEIQDEDGQDKKVSLLDLPAESDWILLASYMDKTLMRDVLAYELWREMGYWAPRWRYVELFVRTNNSALNGLKRLNELHGKSLTPSLSPPDGRGERWPSLESITMAEYAGVYILVEKIKRGKYRLNIKRLKPEHDQEPEITGGYIFKKDRVNVGEKGFRSSHGTAFAFEEPKERDITSVQAQWLTNFVNEFEQVLFSRKFADPTNGYAKYIDVDSFVDYHWFIEVSKNIDAHWFSQFFHKDRDSKLRAGPVWDWDSGWGNAPYLYGQYTNGWRWEQVGGPYYAWYDRLFEDEEFLQRYIDRWAELRRTVFATSNIFARIDQLAKELEPAAIRNHERWHPQRVSGDTNRIPSMRFRYEVGRMKRWIEGRLAWIDGQEFPRPILTRTNEAGQTKLLMASQAGRIFYTLDGSDPRNPGGGVSPVATEYREPIILTSNRHIFARVRSDYNLWSAPVVIK